MRGKRLKRRSPARITAAMGKQDKTRLTHRIPYSFANNGGGEGGLQKPSRACSENYTRQAISCRVCWYYTQESTGSVAMASRRKALAAAAVAVLLVLRTANYLARCA